MEDARSQPEVLQRIKKQIADNRILLYMKGTPQFPQCGFSALAVQILAECGQRFAYVNILENPDIRATLPVYAEWPTFPQLYVRGELIGGSDILKEMHGEGKLKPLLEKAQQDLSASQEVTTTK